MAKSVKYVEFLAKVYSNVAGSSYRLRQYYVISLLCVV